MDLLDEFPVDMVVDEALDEVRAEISAFGAIDPAALRDDVAGALALAAEVMRSGVDEGGLESDALQTIGTTRAEQGIDMDAMLAGFRIVARTAIDALLDIALRRGVDSQATLDLTRAVWGHCDQAAAELATGHRAFTEAPEDSRVRPEEITVRRLVRGELADDALEAACQELGLEVEEPYRVVLAGGPGMGSGLRSDLTRRLLVSYTDSSADRVVGLVDSLPRDPWGCPVGYGDRVPPRHLRRSFQGALLAWEMAVAFHLAEPQHPDDVQLLRAVQALPDLGDELVERCFGHLDPARRESTRQTLRAWFDAHGSTDAAAEALFVHRNTLRYRLRTFSDASGMNLDRPEDAFSLWWALRRLDLLGS